MLHHKHVGAGRRTIIRSMRSPGSSRMHPDDTSEPMLHGSSVPRHREHSVAMKSVAEGNIPTGHSLRGIQLRHSITLPVVASTAIGACVGNARHLNSQTGVRALQMLGSSPFTKVPSVNSSLASANFL
jgi:hypothetical protein